MHFIHTTVSKGWTWKYFLSRQLLLRDANGVGDFTQSAVNYKPKLIVTYKNEPSPSTVDAQDVMQNLTYFITNLTDLGHGDEELAYINRVERKESGGFDEDSFDDDFVPRRRKIEWALPW